MLPGKAKILTCPHCWEKKEVMTVLSYNTFWAIQWSDWKMDMEFDINVSPVQKCPKCSKYYFWYKQDGEEWDQPTFELWTLTYPEMMEAIEQLWTKDLDDEDGYNLYITYLYSYNDWFFRGGKKNKHEEVAKDRAIFCSCINELLRYMTNLVQNWKNVPWGWILVGELYREMWEFENCIQWLTDFNNALNWKYTYVINQIIEHAKNEDRKVFVIK